MCTMWYNDKSYENNTKYKQDIWKDSLVLHVLAPAAGLKEQLMLPSAGAERSSGQWLEQDLNHFTGQSLHNTHS